MKRIKEFRNNHYDSPWVDVALLANIATLSFSGYPWLALGVWALLVGRHYALLTEESMREDLTRQRKILEDLHKYRDQVVNEALRRRHD